MDDSGISETETRFWSIVDKHGLSGLPSDMWTALETLVDRDARARTEADRNECICPKCGIRHGGRMGHEATF